jgi:cardiolipin synthase A/B
VTAKQRLHRVERLRNLRYHHKLVFSVLIVFGILALVVLLAKDKEALKIESAYAATDPRFPDYIAGLVGMQTTAGNRFDVLTNGDAFFPSMLDAINGARRRIAFETYIYETGSVGDRFTGALEAAARRGVQVDLVVDAVGSKKMSRDEAKRLRDAGAHVGSYGTLTWYKLQQVNYRTHRKILVVDGRIAFTGGAGVADHWLGNAQDATQWRDTMVRVEGPLARLMEGAFDENYVRTFAPAQPILEPVREVLLPTPHDSGFVLRSASTGGSNDLKRTYMVAIAAARRTLDICSPYFLLDRSSRWAIEQAAARGVRIRVLTEGDQTDARIVKFASRAAYENLLSRGVEIYEYQPTMLHAKTMVVDGTWSMFGSANFDNRSLEMNDEMNVAVTDPNLAARFTADFGRDLKSATRLRLAEWRQRPVMEKVREHFWAFFGEIF